jgi:4-aminobutyrate aminotransferase-like enzyme
MLAIETVRPGGIEPDPHAAAALLEATRERGVLVGKGGLYGNVIRIAPPLGISEAEAEQGCAALIDAIEAVSASR